MDRWERVLGKKDGKYCTTHPNNQVRPHEETTRNEQEDGKKEKLHPAPKRQRIEGGRIGGRLGPKKLEENSKEAHTDALRIIFKEWINKDLNNLTAEIEEWAHKTRAIR